MSFCEERKNCFKACNNALDCDTLPTPVQQWACHATEIILPIACGKDCYVYKCDEAATMQLASTEVHFEAEAAIALSQASKNNHSTNKMNCDDEFDTCMSNCPNCTMFSKSNKFMCDVCPAAHRRACKIKHVGCVISISV
jgi:hypothetical protein